MHAPRIRLTVFRPQEAALELDLECAPVHLGGSDVESGERHVGSVG